MDVDKDLIKGGWFTNNYSELSRLTKTKWLVGDYDPGDVLIVNIYTFHGSLRNNSDKVPLLVMLDFNLNLILLIIVG